MAMPRSREARDFYRCALQRLEEAYVLLRAGYTTGAVYLAGYTVECTFKSLILSVVPARRATEALREFRGRAGHDYGQLYDRYRRHHGAEMPREITRRFTFVNEWSTDLRYSTKVLKIDQAEEFLEDATAIFKWADERL